MNTTPCFQHPTPNTQHPIAQARGAASGHKIEGNDVGLNYRGIHVLSIRNIIVRNVAGANSNANYSIVAGNTEGPIVNVVGVGNISGTANANTPMANFQY